MLDDRLYDALCVIVLRLGLRFGYEGMPNTATITELPQDGGWRPFWALLFFLKVDAQEFTRRMARDAAEGTMHA